MTKYAGRAPYPFTPGENMTGQCSSCGLAFYGEVAFDRHRRGEEPDRRCVDPETEPAVTGKKSWWLDARDRWHYSTPLTPEEVARIADRVGANKGPGAGSGVPGTPRPAGVGQPRDSEGAA